jgi:hypothetical protein
MKKMGALKNFVVALVLLWCFIVISVATIIAYFAWGLLAGILMPLILIVGTIGILKLFD